LVLPDEEVHHNLYQNYRKKDEKDKGICGRGRPSFGRHPRRSPRKKLLSKNRIAVPKRDEDFVSPQIAAENEPAASIQHSEKLGFLNLWRQRFLDLWRLVLCFDVAASWKVLAE
jgi:hypothetical protein